MKKLIYILLLTTTVGITQNKYLTKNGNITFEASVPSFEEVKATNNTVTAILNTENGEFASLALVKGFRFKNALMEEHFNENYAESDSYPKAIFKGKISDFDASDIKDSYEITGSLTFHGATKTLENVLINLTKNGDSIVISGSFTAKASDYNIKIPKVVISKVAEDIKVDFKFELKKK